jgi:hypothetical protein
LLGLALFGLLIFAYGYSLDFNTSEARIIAIVGGVIALVASVISIWLQSELSGR